MQERAARPDRPRSEVSKSHDVGVAPHDEVARSPRGATSTAPRPCRVRRRARASTPRRVDDHAHRRPPRRRAVSSVEWSSTTMTSSTSGTWSMRSTADRGDDRPDGGLLVAGRQAHRDPLAVLGVDERGRVERDRTGTSASSSAAPGMVIESGPGWQGEGPGGPRSGGAVEPIPSPASTARPHRGQPAMSVTVRVPTTLRTLTAGASEVPVEGSTVGEVLDALESRASRFQGTAARRRRRPAPVRQRVRGRRRRAVPEGLDTPVPDGDTRVDHPGGRRRLTARSSWRSRHGARARRRSRQAAATQTVARSGPSAGSGWPLVASLVDGQDPGHQVGVGRCSDVRRGRAG